MSGFLTDLLAKRREAQKHGGAAFETETGTPAGERLQREKADPGKARDAIKGGENPQADQVLDPDYNPFPPLPSDDATPEPTNGTQDEDPEGGLRISDRFAGPDDLPAILNYLYQSREISLDFETTALTPWAAPGKPGKGALIGGKTKLDAYCATHDCDVDVRPRPRILSLETDSRLACAVDLDRLTDEQKSDLARATTHESSVWVGHNLQFDLMWLQSIAPGATPARIIDTMLLVTACCPDTEADIVRRVAGVAPDHKGIFSAMRVEIDKRIKRRRPDQGEAGLSLNLLSMHFLNEPMDKGYQKPENWMPGNLSQEHLDYCLGDIRQPRVIARLLLGLRDGLAKSIDDVLTAIDAHHGGTAYKTFETALPRLVRMQRNGIRLDPVAAKPYRDEQGRSVDRAMTELLELAPGLKPHEQELRNSTGMSAELKSAVGQTLEDRTGKPCPRTEKAGDPAINSKELKTTYPGEPLVDALLSVRDAVKRLAMIDDDLAKADSASRLHPLTSIATVTGRTSSQEPNLQNIPRDPAFRACFAGTPGGDGRESTKIIASDFSAIEMRIAACLAERAYAEFVFNDLELPGWIAKKAPAPFLRVLTAIRSGDPAAPLIPDEWPLPQPKPGAPFDAWRDYYRSRYAVALARLQAAGCTFKKSKDAVLTDIERMALPGAFRNGIDPHLLTALQSEVRAGRFDVGGKTPLQHLLDLTEDERKALKSELSAARKAAKAPNFGLLYGMQAESLHTTGVTNYGLDWSSKDALEARNAWFEFYPEVELWHLLQKNTAFEKRPAIKYKNIVDTDDGGKLYKSKTLSGRPVCGYEMRDAANYSDQGTGAEIALRAINNLPEWLLDCFVNFVHDELVFEVPTSQAEQAKTEIEACMIAAGDSLMSRYRVPTAVETEIGDYWIH